MTTTTHNTPEIIRLDSGRYVVRDGRTQGRNVNPFGTWNKATAEKELARRLSK